MAIGRDEPYGNAQFRVNIPSSPEAQDFEEVLLPELVIEVEEYREGNDKTRSSRKLPGLQKYSNLVLRRGFTGRLELYQWWKATADGSTLARQTVTVHLLNEHQEPVATWILRNAFPVSYSFSPLNGLDGSPLIETLEVCCESVAME
jgi:phage tail-like protein